MKKIKSFKNFSTINEEMTRRDFLRGAAVGAAAIAAGGGSAMAEVSYDTLWDFLEKNGYNCRKNKKWNSLPEGYEIICEKRYMAIPFMWKQKKNRYSSEIRICIDKKLKESKIKLSIFYEPVDHTDSKIIESLESILGPSKFKEDKDKRYKLFEPDEEFKYYYVSDYFNLSDVNKVKTLINSKIKPFEELILKRGFYNEAKVYSGPESQEPDY